MNKSYKSIWCEKTGTYVAAAEISKAKGKKSGSSRAALGMSRALLVGVVAAAALGGPLAALAETVPVVASAVDAIVDGGTAAGNSATASESAAAADNTTVAQALAVVPVAFGGAIPMVTADDAGGIAPRVTGTQTYGQYVLVDNNGASAATVANNTRGIAAGYGTSVLGDSAGAFGRAAAANGASSFAIGHNVTSIGANSLAIGSNGTTAKLEDAIAIGSNAAANLRGSLAIGTNSLASNGDAVAIGTESNAVGDNSVALGHAAKAHGMAVATGYQAESGALAVAVGAMASATGGRSFAGGTQAKAAGSQSTALGTSASASATNSVALGSSAVADRAQTVSVGNATMQRQVANMAAGSEDTDAVNVAQLKGVAAGLGGGASVNADGSITAPGYVVNKNADGTGGTTFNDVGQAIVNIDGRTTSNATRIDDLNNSVANVEGDITNIQGDINNITSGAIGVVQRGNNANETVLTADGASADAPGAAQKLSNLAAGTVSASSLDAINGAQLHGVSSSVAGALGGGSTVNADGSISAPTYTINGNDYTSIGGAFEGVNNNLSELNQSVSGGSQGVVQRTTNDDETVLTAKSASASNPGAAQKLTNLAAGMVSASSLDAINGAQLHGVSSSVAGALGGGSVVAADGSITAPSYTLTNADGTTTTTINNVGDAISQIDGRTLGNTDEIKALAEDLGTVQSSVAGATRYFKANGQNDGSDDAVASGTRSVAVGANATAAIADSVAIGSGSNASGANSFAGGAAASAGNYSVAIGNAASATDNSSVAVGSQATATLTNALAIGTLAKADQQAVAIGAQAVADGNSAIAAGTSASAAGVTASAFGNRADASGNSSLALGVTAEASATAAIAVGSESVASGTSSSAIGDRAEANSMFATAVGARAKASDSSATAVGFNANATASSAVALGSGSLADRDTTVSVGSASIKRQVVNVAAGTQNNDAVIVSQLKDVVAGLGGGAGVNADGTITAPTYTVTNPDGTTTTTINNVGDAISQIDGRTVANRSSIDSLTEITNNLSDGTVGLVQQAAAGADLTVGAATDGAAVDFTGTAGARRLVGVAEGALAADSQEAVNGSQLFATNENVAQNTTDIAGNRTAIDGLDGRVGTAEGNITTIQGDVSTINTNIGAIRGDITNLDGRVTIVEGSVNDLTTQINNGGVGLVKQAAAGDNLTVGAATDGAAVDFTGTAGARRLVGVAEGALAADSQEAVNGSQLFATNERVGEAEGNIGKLQGDVSTINNHIGAIQGDITTIDGRVTNVESSVTNLTNNLDNGSVGMVKQAAAGANLTVGANTDGVAVDLADKDGNTRALKNVTAGKDKLDAVNVGQLMQAGVIDENGQVQEMLAYDAGSNKGSITLGGADGTRISNVADGTDDQDAVNLRQLKKTGLVDDDGKTLDAVTYDAGSDRSKVTFGDPSAGAVMLSNVAAGRADTDAANVGQLRGVANALGGGAAVNPDGSVTGPTFVLNNEKYTNIGDALTGLAGDIGKTGDRITVVEKVTTTTHNKGDIAISSNGGPEAVATGKDSVAIGPGAIASSDNSVALGAGSTTGNRDSIVSVGSAGNERAIANVADGVMETDAVNKRQLDSVAESNRAYTDVRANQLEAAMDKVKRDSNAAAAAAMAVATLPQSVIPGRGMASAALSNMAGESALAVGVSKVDESGRWVTKVAGTVNTRGNAGVSAGIGFHW